MNLKNKPYISIITACLNRVDFIEKAIQSVLQQNFESYEHIIIDGGSTDGTLDLLKQYPHLRVISEPDAGVYDAMGKGIQLAQGMIIGLLNSDDYYEKNILKTVSNMFLNNEIDAICGDALFINEQGGKFGLTKSINNEEMLSRILYGPPIINAWFFKRNFINELMPFNKNYPLAADRDLLIRAYAKGIRISNYDGVIYYYLQHTGSLTVNTDRKKRLLLIIENLRMAINYMNSTPDKIQAVMKKWYLYLSGEGMKTAFRIGAISEFFKFLFDVIRKNPFWLFWILWDFIKELKRIFRKNKNASYG